MRKRTTSEDIARLTGVSRATVSYVINGRQDTRISPETRERILAVARETGYQRNRLAAALSTGRTNTVGVVTHPNGFRDGRNTYSKDMFLEISLAAARAKQNALMFLEPLVTEADGAEPGLHPNDLSDGRVDGVIAFGYYDRVDWVRQVSDSGLPFVEIGSEVGRFSVLADNRGGIQQALEHLWALGHRRIAHWTHQQHVPSSAVRADSFRETLRAWGANEQECPFLYIETGSLEAALRGPRPPTALVCFNDGMAADALDIIQAAGLRVPEDISLVGFDDDLRAVTTRPALTTVAMPLREMAQAAMTKLLEQVMAKEMQSSCTLVSTRLIVRDSTGAPSRRP